MYAYICFYVILQRRIVLSIVSGFRSSIQDNVLKGLGYKHLLLWFQWLHAYLHKLDDNIFRKLIFQDHNINHCITASGS